MVSGMKQWSPMFKVISRAYLRQCAEAEAEEPDRYVYKPVTGKEKVEINDFESAALDYFEYALQTCSWGRCVHWSGPGVAVSLQTEANWETGLGWRHRVQHGAARSWQP